MVGLEGRHRAWEGGARSGAGRAVVPGEHSEPRSSVTGCIERSDLMLCQAVTSGRRDWGPRGPFWVTR